MMNSTEIEEEEEEGKGIEREIQIHSEAIGIEIWKRPSERNKDE